MTEHGLWGVSSGLGGFRGVSICHGSGDSVCGEGGQWGWGLELPVATNPTFPICFQFSSHSSPTPAPPAHFFSLLAAHCSPAFLFLLGHHSPLTPLDLAASWCAPVNGIQGPLEVRGPDHTPHQCGAPSQRLTLTESAVCSQRCTPPSPWVTRSSQVGIAQGPSVRS